MKMSQVFIYQLVYMYITNLVIFYNQMKMSQVCGTEEVDSFTSCYIHVHYKHACARDLLIRGQHLALNPR